ncbi:DUF29 domain-containing protein [Pseudanabaena yagii]|uniref:DUF29 domain-containing protein n=1 Tax=Pseudanabaena yagii GIHE-NHR1 TaxID=2722753 RepID=A0ABX1LTZ5_9CYAN|nr:DUF29 domain-containing protein [Pseudanabaena yagii]NMF58975.1 DUF29 domain-containing protein [Pseudanabaena yagii GIHE-NHR1]
MSLTITNESLATTNLENTSLYDLDYCVWIESMSQFLREGKFTELDIPNLLEELDDMSGSQRDALESNLEIVLMHLLKYRFQPQLRSRSWLLTIFEHRNRLKKAFKRSPSLQRYYQEVFPECYQTARKMASLETGLMMSDFPEISPFTAEQSLDIDYLPD